MPFTCTPTNNPSLSRRQFLGGLCSCGTMLALPACATGKGGAGGGLFHLSPQQEAQLGAQAWQQIAAKEKKSNDPNVMKIVGDVAGRLIRATGNEGAGMQWEYAVFENPEANAFALPGGKIGVNTGIFKIAENEHQLATVMGHEIRHVTGHHGAQRYAQQAKTSLGLQVASLALGSAGMPNANQVVSLLGAGAQIRISLPFGREQETEADRIGLEYMARAGFDPRQSLKFWENMMSKAGAGRGPSFLSTHPSGNDRMNNLRNKIAEIEGRKA